MTCSSEAEHTPDKGEVEISKFSKPTKQRVLLQRKDKWHGIERSVHLYKNEPDLIDVCPEMVSAPTVNRMAPRGGCRFEACHVSQFNSGVAQLVEQGAVNTKVGGSYPSSGAF